MWKASKLYWIVQLLGWGLFCTLLGINRFSVGDFNFIVLLKLIELYILLVFISHTMRYLLLRLDWINFKITPLIPRLIVLNYLASILLLLTTFLLSLLYSEAQSFTLIELFINSLVYTLFFGLWTSIYLTYFLLQKSRQQEIINLKLIANHHEIELKTLKDQLNPHFLFNSLNSIRALIEAEPKSAKHAITTLSNLLRSSLQMGKKTQVSVEDELYLVMEYLELEKIRFEERLNFKMNTNVPLSIKIPPFIIQTLVENAIKHGISKLSKGGDIFINLSYQPPVFLIQIKNSGKLNSPIRKGIGISNTKRRLHIQYGKDATFNIKQVDEWVVAEIRINFNTNKT